MNTSRLNNYYLKAALYCLLLMGSNAFAQQKIGDNLGTHKATKDLQMNSFQLLDAKGLAIGTASFSSNSVALEISASDKALLISRLANSTDMNALNAVDGMIVYVTADSKFYLRQNGAWQPISTGNNTISTTAPNSSATANGITISPLGVIALSPADAANPGIVTTGIQTLGGDKTFTGVTAIANTTASSSTTSGALVVSGGIGVAKNVNIAGITKITDATPSTSTSTGALVVTGGAGIGGATTIAGITKITDGTNTTSATSGALVVTGSAGILGNLNVGTLANFAGDVKINNFTASTSSSTGTLVVGGGTGIGGDVNIAKSIKGNSSSAANASTSTLSNFSADMVSSTTGRTLSLTDNGKIIVFNSSTAVTVTVPATLH
eukprot:Opistho-1_new@47350